MSGAALECLKSRVQDGGGGRPGSAAHFVGISAEPVQFLRPCLVFKVLCGSRTVSPYDAVVVHRVEIRSMLSATAPLQPGGRPPVRRSLREHPPQRTSVDVARRGRTRKGRKGRQEVGV